MATRAPETLGTLGSGPEINQMASPGMNSSAPRFQAEPADQPQVPQPGSPAGSWPSDANANLPFAPTYYPTAEQFADPYAFIRSVSAEAMKFGGSSRGGVFLELWVVDTRHNSYCSRVCPWLLRFRDSSRGIQFGQAYGTSLCGLRAHSFLFLPPGWFLGGCRDL